MVKALVLKVLWGQVRDMSEHPIELLVVVVGSVVGRRMTDLGPVLTA